MNSSITLEVCCGTYYDCVVAARHHAHRIELCSALELGGLTPSRGLFLQAKKLGLPLAVMVRPRTAGFDYEPENYDIMLMDAQWFAQNGAAAIVFGFLHADGTIDVDRTQTMIDVARSNGVQAVFHKAIDSTVDREASIEQLIDLGIDRILTAGGIGSVADHFDRLAHLQATYGHRIEILPGGGVRLDNIRALLETTLMPHVHMSAKEMAVDHSTIPADINQQMNHDYVRVSDAYLGDVMRVLSTINHDRRTTL